RRKHAGLYCPIDNLEHFDTHPPGVLVYGNGVISKAAGGGAIREAASFNNCASCLLNREAVDERLELRPSADDGSPRRTSRRSLVGGHSQNLCAGLRVAEIA